MKQTAEIAREIRRLSVEMVYKAKASHIGGALSMADILAVLYGKLLKYDPGNPKWEDRDRFLLSKGHACTSLYAALAVSGYFSRELLSTYGDDNSPFICHTSHFIPGIELSTGSLGHALPVGCGIALAAKRKGKSFKTIVLVSDGELDEGSNWEAILFAPQHNLDNLILIVDYNKIQSLGLVSEVLNLESLERKFEAFNWHCISVDGHNHSAIEDAFLTPALPGAPKVIIAHTVKGKGVDFMEGLLKWHYKSPSQEEYEAALSQINRIVP
jgi:transketolase